MRGDGRSLVETDSVRDSVVRRAFDLYAFHGHTIDSLIDELEFEGFVYTDKAPRFTRSKLHTLLQDRAYRGGVAYRGQWYPRIHEP